MIIFVGNRYFVSSLRMIMHTKIAFVKSRKKTKTSNQGLFAFFVQTCSSFSSIDIPLPKPCAIKRKVKEEERDHTPAKKRVQPIKQEPMSEYLNQSTSSIRGIPLKVE